MSSSSAYPKLKVKQLVSKKPLPTLKGEKLHYSNWFLTLSSNVPMKSLGTDKAEAFAKKAAIGEMLRSILRCIFEDPDHLYNDEFPILIQNPRARNYRAGPVAPELVSKTKLEISPIEVGTSPKGGRVHIHALFEVQHFSLLWLDGRNFQLVVRQCFKDYQKSPLNQMVRGVYAHVRWIPSTKPFRNYLTKEGVENPSKKFNKNEENKLMDVQQTFLTKKSIHFWESQPEGDAKSQVALLKKFVKNSR